MILRNVSEDSNRCTCVKSLLRCRNDRREYLDLKERQNSEATKQAIINSAKQTLESLRFKNERIFTLDKFISKLQKVHDELSDCGREFFNGDAVDSLWDRIQSQATMSCA